MLAIPAPSDIDGIETEVGYDTRRQGIGGTGKDRGTAHLKDLFQAGGMSHGWNTHSQKDASSLQPHEFPLTVAEPGFIPDKHPGLVAQPNTPHNRVQPGPIIVCVFCE